MTQESGLKIRKKRNQTEYRRALLDEWRRTERNNKQNTPGSSEDFPLLARLAFLAGEDFRQNHHRYGMRQKRFRFFWKPKHSEPIEVSYYLSRFGCPTLLPPDWAYSTRLSSGLPVDERKIDPWESRVVGYLNGPQGKRKHLVTSTDLLIRILDVDEFEITRDKQMRVGSIMKNLGWSRQRESLGGRRWYYVRP